MSLVRKKTSSNYGSSSKRRRKALTSSPSTSSRLIQSPITKFFTRKSETEASLFEGAQTVATKQVCFEEVINVVNKCMKFDLEHPECRLLTRFIDQPFLDGNLQSQKERQAVPKAQEDILKANILEQCWRLVLPSIRQFLSYGYFMSDEILRSLIHCIVHEENDELSQEAVDILQTHWMLHPPYSNYVKDIYYNFVYGDLTRSDINTTLKYDLSTLLNTLRTCEQKRKLKEQSEANQMIKKAEERRQHLNTDNLFDYIYDFYVKNDHVLFTEFGHDGEEYRGLNNFNATNLNDRGVLFALECVIVLLEQDTIHWLKHNLYTFQSSLEENPPLIGRIFWPDKSSIGSLNTNIRNVFSLFCDLSKRTEELIIMAKLVGLVAEIVSSTEHNPDFKFPFFDRQCYSFSYELAEQMKLVVTNEQINLFRVLRPKWLQLQVGAYLLGLSPDLTLFNFLRFVQSRLLLPCETVITGSIISSQEVTNKELINPSILKSPSKKKLKKDGYGRTKLHNFCRQNDEASLRQYLQRDVDVNETDYSGWTPLHVAIQFRSRQCAKALLEFKEKLTNPCSVSNEGVTPLMLAVETKDIPCIELLLEHGAIRSVWRRSKVGTSAMSTADSNIKNLLTKTWDHLITHANSINLNDWDIRMLSFTLNAYFCVYHTKDKLPDPTVHFGRDKCYTFNYTQFTRDKIVLEELINLFIRLSRSSDNLKLILRVLS